MRLDAGTRGDDAAAARQRRRDRKRRIGASNARSRSTRSRSRSSSSERSIRAVEKDERGFRGGFSLLEGERGGEGTRARDAEARRRTRRRTRRRARDAARGRGGRSRRGRDVDDDGRWMNGRTGTGATATTTGGAAAGSRGYEREDASRRTAPSAKRIVRRRESARSVRGHPAGVADVVEVPRETRRRVPDRWIVDSRASPGRNLFRFRDDGVLASAMTTTFLYELNPAGGVDGPLGMTLSSPRRRVPRKIPRSPYKVLDAPALQDDFYLNLVDWSASNVLAVGLGTCVYLWARARAR